MPFANSHGRETVIAQDFRNESGVFIDTAVKAGETGGVIGDTAHSGCVLVATSEQTGASRRTHRGGVETAIAQTLFGETVEVRRLDV